MSLSPEELLRYERQMLLKEVGAGQEKLSSAKVLVIGAGGLGSAALLYLAGAGVGTIGIADFDKVDLCNLHRQVLYKTSDLKKSKAEAASRAVKALNPDVTVSAKEGLVTPYNIDDLIGEYDYVLDCTDRFETKFLISDACVLAGKPFTHAGVIRFGGQVMTHVPGSPCLRCLLDEIPRAAQTCADVGVMGPAVGIAGCIQAAEAIKFILGKGELLVGKVLMFDALDMRFRTADFPRVSESCIVCGGKISSVKEIADSYTITKKKP